MTQTRPHLVIVVHRLRSPDEGVAASKLAAHPATPGAVPRALLGPARGLTAAAEPLHAVGPLGVAVVLES